MRSGDSYVGNDLSAALPALAPGYDDSFGLAAVKAGVVLSGRISVEEADGGRELDQDTYLLDLANGDKVSKASTSAPPGCRCIPELDSVRRMAVHHGLLGLRERWPGDTGHADGDAAPTRRPT